MISTKKAKREAKQLLRFCLVNGQLDEDRVRAVVWHAVHVGYRDCQPVLAHFLQLVRLDREQHTAYVQSAAPLPPELQAATLANLTRRYGPGTAAEFVLRPSLVGGARIQVGSDVYDGTVQARLAALEKSF
jgi:F-type H+-transporting ATPase subunit delta